MVNKIGINTLSVADYLNTVNEDRIRQYKKIVKDYANLKKIKLDSKKIHRSNLMEKVGTIRGLVRGAEARAGKTGHYLDTKA